MDSEGGASFCLSFSSGLQSQQPVLEHEATWEQKPHTRMGNQEYPKVEFRATSLDVCPWTFFIEERNQLPSCLSHSYIRCFCFMCLNLILMGNISQSYNLLLSLTIIPGSSVYAVHPGSQWRKRSDGTAIRLSILSGISPLIGASRNNTASPKRSMRAPRWKGDVEAFVCGSRST